MKRWKIVPSSWAICIAGGRRDHIGSLLAELILKAAKSGRRADVDAAVGRMEHALRCDGWL